MNKRTLLLIYLAISMSLVFSGLSTAATIAPLENVNTVQSNDFNIQDAINAAKPGDTINIPSGTYYENIIINKNINLIAKDYFNTIIDGGRTTGGKTGSVIIIESNCNVTISGLKIQCGNATHGGGINIINCDSNVTIVDSYISGNCAGELGGGIDNNGNLNLIHTTVSNNRAQANGGGISNTGTLNLKDSRIGPSNWGICTGGGIFTYKGIVNIQNTEISKNTAGDNGGGICNCSSQITVDKSSWIEYNMLDNWSNWII
jgi:hypothetical protein